MSVHPASGMLQYQQQAKMMGGPYSTTAGSTSSPSYAPYDLGAAANQANLDKEEATTEMYHHSRPVYFC